MAYRVRGYPMLQTSRPQGTAAQLGAGKIDLADERPGLLGALERVAEQLRQRVTIVSGYRTDAYSSSVGGFAGDPHTQGIAADAYVGGKPIGLVPHAMRLLAAAGLVSGNQPGFYQGKPDPAHVQLPGAGSSPNVTLESLWTQAGGPPNVARIMAAIALAESGGQVGATHRNADGSIDRGLWQINSSHAAYDPNRLLTDPLYNARAAVAIYRSQGLNAWTTYTSGAYRAELPRAPGARVDPVPGLNVPRTRPSGDPSADSATAQLASWQDYLTPDLNPTDPKFWIPINPLKVFSDASAGVSDVTSFLKWIAWLFHPRNILRAVEFLAGAGLMVVGLATSVKAFEGSSSSTSGGVRKTGVVRKAIAVSPPGRALSLRRAASQGRSAAREARRSSERSAARTKARKAEETRLSNRDFERRTGKRRGPSEEIPF